MSLPYLSPQGYERLESEWEASFMSAASADRILTKLLDFRDRFAMPSLGL